MEYINCSVRNCNSLTDDGDILFCREHRKEWRAFCDTFKLDLDTKEDMIEAGLRAFKSAGC
jgi:hypothetical protein